MSKSHDWINPNGPFQTARNLLTATLIFALGYSVCALFIPLPFSAGDGTLLLLIGGVVAPTVLTAVGIAWVVDNVLAFMKS